MLTLRHSTRIILVSLGLLMLAITIALVSRLAHAQEFDGGTAIVQALPVAAAAPASSSPFAWFVMLQAVLPIWLQAIVALLTGVIAAASLLANVVSPSSPLGRALHWLALNGPKVQNAILAAEGKVQPMQRSSGPGLRTLVLVLAGGALLSAPARAACPVYKTSHGPMGTLYRASLDPKAGLAFQKVNFGGGYSYQLGLLPNGDCSVYWLSVLGGGLLNVGGAPVGPGAAVNITPIGGLGLYNSIVRVMAGYDAISLGSNLSGLFLGKPTAQNFSLFVGVGVNFDLSALAAPVPAELEGKRAEVLPPALPAEPPGFVRP